MEDENWLTYDAILAMTGEADGSSKYKRIRALLLTAADPEGWYYQGVDEISLYAWIERNGHHHLFPGLFPDEAVPNEHKAPVIQFETSQAGKALRAQPRPKDEDKERRYRDAMAEAITLWEGGDERKHHLMAKALFEKYDLPQNSLRVRLKSRCFKDGRSDRVFNAKTAT